MRQKTLAICGVILLLGGVSLNLYLRSASSDARDLDRFDAPEKSRGQCSSPLEEVSISRRIMSKNDSLAMTAVLFNSDRNENCEVAINLNAPNFNISPNEPDLIINLPPRKRATPSWILSPRQLGTFEVAVSAELSSQIVGIKVTDNLIDLFPSWVIFIAYGLGPMLTVPWWYEQWQKHKNSAKSKNS
jgi:hypothetical protein